MSKKNPNLPDEKAFVYNLRRFLSASGKEDISTLLINAECNFYEGDTDWGITDIKISLYLPVTQLAKADPGIKHELEGAIRSIFPTNFSYNIITVDITALINTPPIKEPSGLNNAQLGRVGAHEHDGLLFRSKSEIKIYDTLKNRNILFFPGAAAVLGNKNLKKEPDFLICQNGIWGILEVMGEEFHQNAPKDHDRGRLFKEYGLLNIEFYDAGRCYNEPEKVVNEFLTLLSRAKFSSLF